MREIKFRGRRIDNGEWVYGDLLRGTNKEDYADITMIWTYFWLEVAGDFEHDYYIVDPKTVGQFIGELDKDKNEIYERDTIIDPYQIARDDPAYGVYEEKYIVKFVSGMFTLQEKGGGDFVLDLPDWKNLMVVENPELVGEK